MITNFYTLRALVEEWRGEIVGSHLGDAFSQEPDELTLAFAAPGRDQIIRLGTRLPLQFMFRAEGYSKARRNVATLFEDAFDRRVEDLRIADRDRMILLSLDGGMELRVLLFGPRANVFLIADGRIAAAFHDEPGRMGSEPPEPRPAPSPDSFPAFSARWRNERKTVSHALAAACPLFDRTLAAEAAFRSGINPDGPPDLDAGSLERLFRSVEHVRMELLAPAPRVYWRGADPILFSIIPLAHVRPSDRGEASLADRDGLPGRDQNAVRQESDLAAVRQELSEELFGTTDEAARVFVRRSLARRRFRELFDPVEQALEHAVDHYRASAERMLEELSSESRAGQYERWGHLLMAKAGEVPAGAEEVELQDLFTDGATVTVPLDPSLSAVENAERYYDRARRTRRSREEAENRLVQTEERAEKAARLLEALRQIDGLREIRAFRSEHAGALAPFLPNEERSGDGVPFRRFHLGGGYEVWVGRNARQNDELTFHHAQKYDLWMHARGAPGSHAVLRLPNRSAEPDRRIIYQAAAIAAYFSKARGSALVPVMVAERKYVRKPRGAPPGAVAVEREDVVLVEPALPR